MQWNKKQTNLPIGSGIREPGVGSGKDFKSDKVRILQYIRLGAGQTCYFGYAF